MIGWAVTNHDGNQVVFTDAAEAADYHRASGVTWRCVAIMIDPYDERSVFHSETERAI